MPYVSEWGGILAYFSLQGEISYLLLAFFTLGMTMAFVRIYQPIKNPMQSGKAKQAWVVEYNQEDTRFVEPLMGWTGNQDTKPQLKLSFKTKEDAIAYAQRKGLEYQVILPNQPTLKLQSYADNFTS